MARKLNAKQATFVSEYLKDFNATQAAIRAGYSPKTAGQIGGALLKKVEIQLAISAVQEKRLAKADIDGDRLLRELNRVALFDPRRLFGPDGSPRSLPDLDDDTVAAVAGLDVIEQFDDDGLKRGDIKKWKLANKLGAIELLLRHLGLLNDKLDVTSKGDKLEGPRVQLFVPDNGRDDQVRPPGGAADEVLS